MACFDHSIDLVLKAEGGYSDHPKDKGGATRYGITQSTLNTYNRFYDDVNPATLHVKHLDVFRAREIYLAMYWAPLRLDEISDQKLAHLIFDQGVNQGGQIAVKRMQKVYNIVNRGANPLAMDGIVGPITIAQLNECNKRQRICLEFIKHSQVYYCNIVRVQPDQIVFLSGWLARTHWLLDFLLFARV